MTRVRRLVLVVAVAGIVGTGCSSGSPGDISRSAAAVLQPAVQHVREVAAIGDYSDLQAAVQQLKSLIRQQERAGNVTSQRAAALLDAADSLLLDARNKMSPTPTPTPTSESPTTTPTPTETSSSSTPPPTTTPPTSPTSTTSPIVSTSVGTGGGNGNGGGGGGGGGGDG